MIEEVRQGRNQEVFGNIETSINFFVYNIQKKSHKGKKV